jgi:ribosome biogenesis GTPase / thiamine phosphate phosphatase
MAETVKQVLTGVIMRSTGSWYTVAGPGGVSLDCRLKGRFRIKGIMATNPLAVGDRVEYELQPGEKDGVITRLFDRDNYIIRRATKLSKSSHVIAANIDQMLLVVTLVMPWTSPGFIDRVLVTAEAYHIPSIIIINKTDIYDEKVKERMEELTGIYEGAGYRIIRISAETGNGMDELRQAMQGKVSLITGNSGVGKSTIINKLEPSLNLKVMNISAYHEKGQHATTFAEMHALSFGGYIIDTPGIREFGLVDFDRQEVSERFPEMRQRMQHCRYSNCTHTHEPDCAVKEAVETGEISQRRYDSYLRIFYNDDWEEEKSY